MKVIPGGRRGRAAAKTELPRRGKPALWITTALLRRLLTLPVASLHRHRGASPARGPLGRRSRSGHPAVVADLHRPGGHPPPFRRLPTTSPTPHGCASSRTPLRGRPEPECAASRRDLAPQTRNGFHQGSTSVRQSCYRSTCAGQTSTPKFPAGLLRSARNTVARVIRSALEDAGYDDLPANGPYVINATSVAGVPLAAIIDHLRLSKQASGPPGGCARPRRLPRSARRPGRPSSPHRGADGRGTGAAGVIRRGGRRPRSPPRHLGGYR